MSTARRVSSNARTVTSEVIRHTLSSFSSPDAHCYYLSPYLGLTLFRHCDLYVVIWDARRHTTYFHYTCCTGSTSTVKLG